MPRYYYLFPSHYGPFPNPFGVGDRLFEISQHAIQFIRSLEQELAISAPSKNEPYEKSESYQRWLAKTYFAPLEACYVAFVEMINRVLTKRPPTEAHWDFAALESAHRAVALVFYIHYEAFGDRLAYQRKRDTEALLTDWLVEAKNIWRERSLDPSCNRLLARQTGRWNVPTMATFLKEELWKVKPDTLEKPLDLIEKLFKPASFAEASSNNITEWIDDALRGDDNLWVSIDFPGHLLDQSEGRGNRLQRSTCQFPKRAKWLDQRLRERGWSSSDPSLHNGPDRKTIEKLLRGDAVRNDVLKKLADALSKKVSAVNVLEVPDA